MIQFRQVGLHDAEALQQLMELNADYTLRVQGTSVAEGAAIEALTALPPNTTNKQKFGFGLWEAGKLIAFADVIQSWPEPDTAHIGLLMTDPRRRGEGLGRQLHESIISEMSMVQGLMWLRISIVEANAEIAEPFWIKMGYTPTDVVAPYSYASVESRSRIWHRRLHDKHRPRVGSS